MRHLVRDDVEKAEACTRLFERVERGAVSAWTTELVIAEVAYVLNSPRMYAADRLSLRDGLLPLLDFPGLRLARKRLYPRVFELYTALPIDFPDAYHAALLQSRNETTPYSYDEDFDRVGGLTRLEL